jgi:hypothetical protein
VFESEDLDSVPVYEEDEKPQPKRAQPHHHRR